MRERDNPEAPRIVASLVEWPYRQYELRVRAQVGVTSNYPGWLGRPQHTGFMAILPLRDLCEGRGTFPFRADPDIDTVGLSIGQ